MCLYGILFPPTEHQLIMTILLNENAKGFTTDQYEAEIILTISSIQSCKARAMTVGQL